MKVAKTSEGTQLLMPYQEETGYPVCHVSSEFAEAVLFRSTRLDRSEVRQLIAHLQEWIETGSLEIGLTPEEAQKAYDEAVPVPMSEERIDQIVRFATSKTNDLPSVQAEREACAKIVERFGINTTGKEACDRIAFLIRSRGKTEPAPDAPAVVEPQDAMNYRHNLGPPPTVTGRMP